jgi:hypothetical protein
MHSIVITVLDSTTIRPSLLLQKSISFDVLQETDDTYRKRELTNKQWNATTE